MDAGGNTVADAGDSRAERPNGAATREQFILEASGVGTWEYRLADGHMSWSSLLYKMWGRDPALGPPGIAEWRALVHPDDIRHAFWDRNAIAANGGKIEAEFRVVHPDGAVRTLASRATLILDENGRPVEYIGVNIDVTDKRANEAALRDAQIRLNAALDAAEVGTWTWPLPGERMIGDANIAKLFGVSEAEACGGFAAVFRDRIHPEDRDRVSAELMSAIKSRGAYQPTYRVIAPDSTTRWQSARGRVRTDDAGKPISLDGAVVDITELKENEARLRLVARVGRVGHFEWVAATGIATLSPEYRAIYGLPDTNEQLTSDEWVALIHSDDRDRILADIERANLDPTIDSIENEHRIIHATSGKVCWVLNRTEMERGPDGRIVRVIGAQFDITAPKEAETALRESEARLRLAIDAGRMAVYEHNLVTDELRHSPELNRLLGFPDDRKLRMEDVRARYAPGELERLRALRSESLARRERFPEVELQMVAPDGQPRWFLLRADTRTDDEGRALTSTGVLLDITERKRAEEHQHLLINELNHRVKNTLAIIQGIAVQTFRGTAATPEARAAFEGRLEALAGAHDLLTRGNWESAALEDIIERAIAPFDANMARVSIEGPELRLQPKTAVSVALALHELATNALKYGALSTPAGHVDIRWQIAGERLHLDWRERGGPPVRPPSRRGFGTRMIERGLATELRGTVRIDFQPDGVLCTIDAPVGDAVGLAQPAD